MLGYIHTAAGITVIHRNRSVTMSAEDARYPAVIDIIAVIEQGGYVSAEDLDAALTSPKEQINAALHAQSLSSKISVSDTDVLYNGKPIHNSLTVRLLEHLRQGISVAPLVPFLENLLQNPSYRAVQDLYQFLERGNIPLSNDGHFFAYKAVRSDWMDIHSGTFDNSVGKIVEIPRNEVDEDPNRTCSNGLHVCSFDYLPSFAHADGHVVIVKINPRDVVAIPTDYNLSKMRVCRYEVIGEVEGYYTERRNVLAESPVFGWPDRPDEDVESDFEEEDEDEDENEGGFAVTLYTGSGSTFASKSYSDWDDAVDAARNALGYLTPKAVVEGPIGKVTFEL